MAGVPRLEQEAGRRGGDGHGEVPDAVGNVVDV